MKKKLLLLLLFSSILYSNFTFTQSANLDAQELNALKIIWKKLGLAEKKEWEFDFHNDPCGKGTRDLAVLCDCSFESNVTCHVIALYITSQNVSTNLPSEFVKLQYLQTLDLSCNYLKGTIPSEWATMRLSHLSLMGNRLSGPFPTVLTRITTLLYLNIEGNHFSAPIPKEIANLKNLKRISDNNFMGKIPNFISQWTQIRNLHIQGCSFEGPIPSSISVLTQLNDLRISDLKGGTSTFPPLEEMTQLSILVLRNCLIHGPIPGYVGYLRSLRTLDLSYNHFTWDASAPVKCEQGTINVVESYSSSTKEQKNIHPCLRKDFPCTKSDAQKIHSLHINCGGEEVNIKNIIKYEADTEKSGASSYYNAGNWAFSSTGNFLDEDHDSDVYILSNTSALHNIPTCDTELYTTARKAAISLTYYGLCLLNGNYTVRLHFAEIGFTQSSSNTLGKRVFNVYVQGELKLIDFDIAKEAGGTSIAVIKSYIVNVKNNTLKIQLYWAGKGTTGIPIRGSYGPIISAISVDPNYMPLYIRKRLDVGLIVGLVGGVSLVLIIMVCLWRKGYKMSKNQPIELGQMSHNTSFS